MTVQLTIQMPFDLEKAPLELKTNSTLGSGDILDVYFQTIQGEDAGDVGIYFFSTYQYWILDCNDYWTDFPNSVPSEVEKIWRITADKSTLSGIRLMIHCNGIEVLNIILSDSTCPGHNWSRDVEKIYFPNYDSASDYYRAALTGNSSPLPPPLPFCPSFGSSTSSGQKH